MTNVTIEANATYRNGCTWYLPGETVDVPTVLAEEGKRRGVFVR